jgi:hypothetical protein
MARMENLTLIPPPGWFILDSKKGLELIALEEMFYK